MRQRLLASSMICGAALAALASTTAYAQDEVTEVVVTGSRIKVPGLVSASPITSVSTEEIRLQQVPEAEKIIRFLPISVPSDGANVNNGTAGVSTVNLRGLGAQRNLIMLNGKRITPYNINGRVDVSNVPLAIVERMDVVTGGASAVYGSDAMSGVVNFITKDDFEGIEFNGTYSQTGERDGKIYNAAVTMGANSENGRGNAVVSLNYAKREGVLLAQRPFGLLGVVTADGSNLNASSPALPPAGCQAPGAVAAGGSTTTIPTRMSLAGSSLGQFRDDGTLGANCSVFNFNPFNYYQTPQERYGGLAMAHYDVTDNMTAYSTVMFSKTTVRQQIAPSGVFGNLFWVPLANPYLSAQAKAAIIAKGESLRTGGTLTSSSWRDLNANGVVDTPDDVQLSIRRRTLELGPRSSNYDNNTFQVLVGLKGTVLENWDWDASFQHGEVTRTSIAAGYTNVANFQNALDAVSKTACRNGDSTCVPVNVFGGFGTITPAMAKYVGAVGIEEQLYTQNIASATIGGPVEAFQSPWASSPLSISLGAEYREEFGETIPDECLKLAPSSCLGGAGGNTLPIKGGFSVGEVFGETLLPLINDKPFAKSVTVELGYRYSDYDPTGVNRTWKAGLNWSVTDDFRIRVMQQKAARAPNVGELAAPVVTSLDNATLDPCSIGNAAKLAGNTALRNTCIATGMFAAQVGTVQDIVAGQINTFSGSNPAALPAPETADTFTVGFVWQPSFLPLVTSPALSVDYYDIQVNDYIGTQAPQEVLDDCYVRNQAAACSRIVRVNGDLATPGSGIQLFTTNLDRLRAEGIEVAASFGVNLEDLGLDSKWGDLKFSYNANHYLTSDSRSNPNSADIDCLGYFGTTCGNPLHKFRFVQRTSWNVGDFQLSYLWRHMSKVSVEEVQKPDVYNPFETIKAYNYIDLSGTWNVNDAVRLTASVTNAFDKNPPIVGNEAGTTSANSGNTFPSNFDTLGRVYAVGVNLRF